MIDIKADSKNCLIREITGSEIEILTDIIAASTTLLDMLFQQANTSKKNKKMAIKIFTKELIDEFLKE